tara:strand:- start:113 stop:1069 length:957 start_codon:yes stop_codon:yes gene_type:complete
MSEISTSPEVETADTVDAGSAEVSATESTTAPETVQTQTADAQQDSATTPAVEASPEETPQSEPTNPFNIDSWDGNIDLLPEDLRGPVRYLHKNLESGYTKKFQTLASERKQFEDDRNLWQTEKSAWDEGKSDLEAERDLLKRILAGSEDPRVGELTTANTELQANIEKLQGEYEAFQKMVDEDIEEQAKDYADKFANAHPGIFEDDVKRGIFSGLLEKEWEPEIAVKLVDADERVVELATQLREQGASHNLAFEHALLKAGTSKARKAPRPGAKLTAGAESKNNPESTVGDTMPRTSKDARFNAARAAVNWRKEQGL